MSEVFDASTSTAELAHHWFKSGNIDAECQILARAGLGDLEAQRVLVDAMTGAAIVEDEGLDSYLAAAELMARMAASRGIHHDRLRLASVLSLHAAHQRSVSRLEEATSLEADCLLVLHKLDQEGCEEAAGAMNGFAPEFSRKAVEAARLEAKRHRGIPQVGHVAPLDWDALFASLPPVTRLERVKFWLQDRGWDVRFYFRDLGWALCNLGRAIIGRS
jgi:hypothetical protein